MRARTQSSLAERRRPTRVPSKAHKRARIIELACARCRILHEKPAGIYLDRTIRKPSHKAPIHRTRRGAREVYALWIVFAAMAGAVKHVLLRQPVRRATEVRASRED